MVKQRLLLLDLDDQERLWRQLPDQSRIELTALYARVIAHAARVTASPRRREASGEVGDR